MKKLIKDIRGKTWIHQYGTMYSNEKGNAIRDIRVFKSYR